MHYYIDGYNLLFRILKTGDDLQKQRKALTLDLENKCSILNIDATLVFDSHYQEDENVRSHFKSLSIVFTGLGESADEYILQELKECKNASVHTVVTSDKKLALHCRLRLAKTESVDEFLAWLNKRYKNRLKEDKKQSSPFTSLQKHESKPIPIEPPPPPPPNEGSFDFYLEKFEASSKLLVEEKKKKTEIRNLKKNENSKKKSSKPKLVKEESKLSDMDRWLKAFQAD